MTSPQSATQSPDALASDWRRAGTFALLLACWAVAATLAWAPGIIIAAAALHQ